LKTANTGRARSRFKVLHHRRSSHASVSRRFNALLKTLEEPPSHVKFIFGDTPSRRKVLPTILSRCQRYDFRNIPRARDCRSSGGHLAKKEKIKADEDALLMVAKVGGGDRCRDALLAARSNC